MLIFAMIIFNNEISITNDNGTMVFALDPKIETENNDPCSVVKTVFVKLNNNFIIKCKANPERDYFWFINFNSLKKVKYMDHIGGEDLGYFDDDIPLKQKNKYFTSYQFFIFNARKIGHEKMILTFKNHKTRVIKYRYCLHIKVT